MNQTNFFKNKNYLARSWVFFWIVFTASTFIFAVVATILTTLSNVTIAFFTALILSSTFLVFTYKKYFVNFQKTNEHSTVKIVESNKSSNADTASLVRIMVAAANPSGISMLNFDEEYRGIFEALQRSKLKNKFKLELTTSSRISDLRQELLIKRPNIIHFAGHGDLQDAIIFENEDGSTSRVSDETLNQLFLLLADQKPRLVILNACYSANQARAIAKHVDGVIGISEQLGDEAALQFARAFYQALGYGRSIKDAFDLGLSQIAFAGVDETFTPIFITKQPEGNNIVFAHSN